MEREGVITAGQGAVGGRDWQEGKGHIITGCSCRLNTLPLRVR